MDNNRRSGTQLAPATPRSVQSIDTQKLLEAENLLKKHDRGIARTFFPVLRAISKDADLIQIETEKQVHRDELHFMLERSLTVEQLNLIGAAVDEATSAGPDESVIEVCLSVLIDTQVRLPSNLPIYLEALIHDLKDGGFSPHVVAAACQRIRRECKFLPAISEVLTMCRDIEAHYLEQQRRIQISIKDRKEVQRYLAELGA